ncbi:glycoside hydrolase [Dendrothele bispora CBS 962.96]|uniref:Glycoside hydrolase n=1 Tax=Dendrothele bispora (strain CBS 962.96) TaxID=1314807 RepID=A0A4S8LIV8_DENBC|nr:glycoside hydrolase [Dendrothele bispora CBS 962.96]
MTSLTINLDPSRHISLVDPGIYSGFTEHMGRYNKHGLSDLKTSFREDVLAALKELNVPIFRYPGGNFHLLPRRPELAWLTEESNRFGTDEFMEFCKVMDAETYICLNMGTGTLEDALAWLEYCNRYAPWDRVTLKKLLPVVDYHLYFHVLVSLNSPLGQVYTVSEGDHSVNVIGLATAEKAIYITKSLIDLAKNESGLDKEVTVQLYEDPVRAPGGNGAEEHYNLSDAIVKPPGEMMFTDCAIHAIFTTSALRMNTSNHDATATSKVLESSVIGTSSYYKTLLNNDYDYRNSVA